MQANLDTTWIIEASAEEMRLILRSLRGVIKDESELKAAAELANLITEQRFKSAQRIADAMKKHFLASIEGK